MVDTMKMEAHFLEVRKKTNKEMEGCKGFKPYNEKPHLMHISYNNGKGGMVIDMDALGKLPKSIQNKIWNLGGK